MGCFTMLLSISAVCYSLGAAAADSQPDYRLAAAAGQAEGDDECAEGDAAIAVALLSVGSGDSRHGSQGGSRELDAAL